MEVRGGKGGEDAGLCVEGMEGSEGEMRDEDREGERERKGGRAHALPGLAGRGLGRY